jgi:hypothetical protein
MSNEELKKIVEEVIGNNDPFWNEPVFEVVKKINNENYLRKKDSLG